MPGGRITGFYLCLYSFPGGALVMPHFSKWLQKRSSCPKITTVASVTKAKVTPFQDLAHYTNYRCIVS